MAGNEQGNPQGAVKDDASEMSITDDEADSMIFVFLLTNGPLVVFFFFRRCMEAHRRADCERKFESQWRVGYRA